MTEQLDKFVAELAEMTDCNDHSGSLVRLTEEFDCLEEYRERAKAIRQRHLDKGRLAYDQMLDRESIRNACVARLRKMYDDETATKIYQAM